MADPHSSTPPSSPGGEDEFSADPAALETTPNSVGVASASESKGLFQPIPIALAVIAILALGVLFVACRGGSNDGVAAPGSDSDDPLASVTDSDDSDAADSGSDDSSAVDSGADDSTDTAPEDLSDPDRLGIDDEPPPPASVPSDVEGSLACAKVEAALIAAESGDVDAIDAELATARDRLTQAGPVLTEAGTNLIPQSSDEEDWQANAYDFLDVCSSTGYEPFVTRPEAGADG